MYTSLTDKILKDENIKLISGLLKNYEIYIVGGFIRDLFFDVYSPDKDIVVTNEKSEKIADIIANSTQGTKILLDKENEIYRVVAKDKINYFDITQTKNIHEDAKRRDFTINSIYYDINNNKIFDPNNGLNDIKNRILKTSNINNFKDDSLRMLRYYRFLSILGFSEEKNITDYIKNNSNDIKKCAKERINTEIIKMFSGKNLIDCLISMNKNRLLSEIFPFTSEINKIPKNSYHHLPLFEHSLETIRNLSEKNNPYLNIGAFMHDIGKPKTWTIDENGRHRFIGHDIEGEKLAKKELENLKFSNKQIDYISKLVRYHMYPALLMSDDNVTDKAKYRFFKKTDEMYRDIIDLAKSDRLSTNGEAVSQEDIKEDIKKLEELEGFCNKQSEKIKTLPRLLTGKDIMEILNIKPSKKVGEILSTIEEMQIEGKITTKEDAIKFIKTI